MTWCDKIHADDILHKMDETDLDLTLTKCEQFCPKYHWCDTVALMQDEYKYKTNECLKCPYCEKYMEHCDCPDLFTTGSKEWEKSQYKLLQEIQSLGYNIVTCGHCGQVFIHKI